MKKYIFLMLIIPSLISCARKINDFYAGRVIDENNNPLEDVIVAEDNLDKQVKTDKTGYFKLQRTPNWFGSLIFIKEGYRTDTILSVRSRGEYVEYNFVKHATTIQLKLVANNETLDLIVTQPESEDREIPEHWESLNAIQKEWIVVEKDEEGYLIYEPCDGSTPTILLENGFLSIEWQIGPITKFSYEKFTRLVDKKSFRLDAYDNETEESFEVRAKIVDSKNGLVIWEFDDRKWLMTPIENFKKFRHIKNNCPDYKRNELQFSEFKYD